MNNIIFGKRMTQSKLHEIYLEHHYCLLEYDSHSGCLNINRGDLKPNTFGRSSLAMMKPETAEHFTLVYEVMKGEYGHLTKEDTMGLLMVYYVSIQTSDDLMKKIKEERI